MKAAVELDHTIHGGRETLSCFSFFFFFNCDDVRMFFCCPAQFSLLVFVSTGAVVIRNSHVWPMVRIYRGGFLLIEFLFLLGMCIKQDDKSITLLL